MKNTNGKISKQLNSLLSERLVVQKTMYIDDRICDNVRILYGETYDKYGITIDSLKYYLFMEYLARTIGPNAHGVVVEGDLHSIINPLVVDKELLLKEGARRVDQVKAIIGKLQLRQVSVRLMSELFEEKKVIDLVNTVASMVKGNAAIQNMLIPTVLQNRIAQEKTSGFRYGAEAIGLALTFDLKVGPPREENYDIVAQTIGQGMSRSYSAIYLRPSYPFTSDFSFYLTHPEIEEYGLTPYKAGSNKMQDFRIVLERTSDKEITELISACYVPRDIRFANPLVDLASIVAMSDQIRQDKIDVLELGNQIRMLVQNRDNLTVKVLKLLREVI